LAKTGRGFCHDELEPEEKGIPSSPRGEKRRGKTYDKSRSTFTGSVFSPKTRGGTQINEWKNMGGEGLVKSKKHLERE